MSDLKNYNLPELLDFLRQHTFNIRIISQSSNRKDVETSKTILKKIQAEIKQRKEAVIKQSVSPTLPG